MAADVAISFQDEEVEKLNSKLVVMQNTPNNNIGLTLIFRRFREMDIENQKQYVSRDYLTISIDGFFERTKDLIKLMC